VKSSEIPSSASSADSSTTASSWSAMGSSFRMGGLGRVGVRLPKTTTGGGRHVGSHRGSRLLSGATEEPPRARKTLRAVLAATPNGSCGRAPQPEFHPPNEWPPPRAGATGVDMTCVSSRRRDSRYSPPKPVWALGVWVYGPSGRLESWPKGLVDGQFDRMNGTRAPHVVLVGSTKRSAAGAV
jgi:hypothetical protein